MSKLEEQTLKIIDDILSCDLVKKYFIAKNEFLNNPELNKMREDLDFSKKRLPSLSPEERFLEVSRLQKLEKEIDNSPYSLIYFQLKKEVEDLIEPFYSLFKIDLNN